MEMRVYSWKPGSRVDADPQVVGKELQKLCGRGNGMVEPEKLVQVARNPKNVLHTCFEWDDTVAAGLYRQEQARYILRSIEVEVVRELPTGEQTKTTVRAFRNVTEEERRGYADIHQVITNDEWRSQVIGYLVDHIRSWGAEVAVIESLSPALPELKAALQHAHDQLSGELASASPA